MKSSKIQISALHADIANDGKSAGFKKLPLMDDALS